MPSRNASAVAALAMVWIVIILAIHPSFAFPLNDDWSFTAMLTNFTQRHVLLPTDVTSMPLVGQILWATPFVWMSDSVIAGARMSTLVLGLIGPLAIFACLRQLGVSIAASCIGALALMTNPLWISLSCTFMTDVPFTAVALVAAALFIAAKMSGRASVYVAALACVVWATLIRQLSLAFAAGAAVLPLSPRASKAAIVRACLPLATSVVVLAAYSAWLGHAVGLPALYQRREFEALTAVGSIRSHVSAIALGVIATCLYTGWGLIPLTPLVARARGRYAGWPLHLAVAACSVIAFTVVLMFHKTLPVTGNVLEVSGLGALTLTGAQALPALSPLFRAAVTLLAIWSGMYAAAALIAASFDRAEQPAPAAMLFVVTTGLVYAAVIVQVWVFDRYLLPLIGIAVIAAIAAGAGSSPPRWTAVAAALLLGINAAIGILGTKDYIAWNAARWAALHDLESRGIRPADIDGGYEYNGMTSYDPARPLGSVGWWSRADAKYRVSFAQDAGWATVASYPYRTLLPPSQRQLFVLRK